MYEYLYWLQYSGNSLLSRGFLCWRVAMLEYPSFLKIFFSIGFVILTPMNFQLANASSAKEQIQLQTSLLAVRRGVV